MKNFDIRFLQKHFEFFQNLKENKDFLYLTINLSKQEKPIGNIGLVIGEKNKGISEIKNNIEDYENIDTYLVDYTKIYKRKILEISNKEYKNFDCNNLLEDALFLKIYDLHTIENIKIFFSIPGGRKSFFNFFIKLGNPINDNELRISSNDLDNIFIENIINKITTYMKMQKIIQKNLKALKELA